MKKTIENEDDASQCFSTCCQECADAAKRWWMESQLKTQTLILFGGIMGLAVAFIVVLCIVAIEKVSDYAVEEAVTALKTAITRNLVQVGEEIGQSVTAEFVAWMHGVGIMGRGLVEGWEPNQVFQLQAGIWEEAMINTNTPCAQEKSTRANVTQCLTESSYYLTELASCNGQPSQPAKCNAGQPSAALNADPMLKDHTERSWLLGVYAPPIYTVIVDFLTIYFGIPVGPAFSTNSVFRQYPGEYRESTTYQPTARPWFKDAYTANGTAITDPYRSASLGVWEITISKALYRGTTSCVGANTGLCTDSNFIGVLGADILIEKLTEELTDDQSSLAGGFSTLYQTDGTVVVHPHWNYASASTTTTIDAIMSNSQAAHGCSYPFSLNQAETSLHVVREYCYYDPTSNVVDVLLGTTSEIKLKLDGITDTTVYYLTVFAVNSVAMAPLTALTNKVESDKESARETQIIAGTVTIVLAIIISLVLSFQIAGPVIALVQRQLNGIPGCEDYDDFDKPQPQSAKPEPQNRTILHREDEVQNLYTEYDNMSTAIAESNEEATDTAAISRSTMNHMGVQDAKESGVSLDYATSMLGPATRASEDGSTSKQDQDVALNPTATSPSKGHFI